MKGFKDHDSFKRFLESQVNEIRAYREEEVRKTGRQDFQQISQEWIASHAQEFRDKYMNDHPQDVKDE